MRLFVSYGGRGVGRNGDGTTLCQFSDIFVDIMCIWGTGDAGGGGGKDGCICVTRLEECIG